MTPLPLRNLDYVVLLCRDLAPMQRFYHGLLGLPVYRDWPDWLELQVGSSLLTLRPRGRPYDGGAPSGSAGVQLAFRVTPDDLDAWHAQLAAQGVEVVDGPMDRGTGHRAVFFRDPEGNIVELYADVAVQKAACFLRHRRPLQEKPADRPATATGKVSPSGPGQ
jgi:catechol-2,3-dioxygenase